MRPSFSKILPMSIWLERKLRHLTSYLYFIAIALLRPVPYTAPYYYPSATATGTPPNPNSPARRPQGLYASGPHVVGNGSVSARSGVGPRRNGYQKAAKAGSAAYRRPNTDDHSKPGLSAIEEQTAEAVITEADKQVSAEKLGKPICILWRIQIFVTIVVLTSRPFARLPLFGRTLSSVNQAQDFAAGQNDAKDPPEQSTTGSPRAKPEVEGERDENDESGPDTHSFSSPPACRGPTPIIRPMLGQSPGLVARRPPRKSPSDRLPHSSQYALGTNVYIRGLPVDTTDAGFAEIARMCVSSSSRFTRASPRKASRFCWPDGYGSIVSSKAIIEHSTGECRGYGFVMYQDVQQARAAIAGLTARGFQATPAKVRFWSY
ncbi:MAG: hypothetical protein BJ554DRAFT_5644 [Olpidium bornovanus]|uniref:RRM domain-containing protein n=1 Tax=Olpidium bornovanus TaxID=278681 RepID=A0A8H8DKU5_9FUNG|nr:MAG: hypothetical protein BJ554DRAFT_5644 [Olpidium bornovanus]